jgi:hypothetical protein
MPSNLFLGMVRQYRANGATWEEIAVGLSVSHPDHPWAKLTGDQVRKRYQRAVASHGFEAKRPSHNWTYESDRPRKHLVIPDTQIKPGVPLEHLYWIGRYAAHKKVDVLVQIVDWAEMHSLSSYDRGKRAGENARYSDDVDYANEGLAELHRGLDGYEPELKLWTIGNHEQRIERFVNDNPELYGHLDYTDFDFERRGWVVAPFLQPVEVDGILYCHFFPRSANGKVMQMRYGAPNAKTQVQREHQSATAGHSPGLDVACVPTSRGLLRGLIAGSCYQHDATDEFAGPQSNNYWRGVYVKHWVHDGQYNGMEVDLDFLRRKYS